MSAAASARVAVRCLRAGIVPPSEIDQLSGAYDSIRRITERNLLSLRSSGHGKALLVRGEWGSGKTHFLSYVRAAAARNSISTATIVLNARSTPLNYPQRIYPVIAETLRVGEDAGLKAVLTRALRRIESPQDVERALASHEYSGPIRELLRVTREDAFHEIGGHWGWTPLLGADIAAMDYAYKREQALARLRALGLILRTLGFGGLVLLFDEAETIDQLWNVRSRVAAYDVLGRMCHTDALWCIFAVTERFDRMVQLDLARDVLADPGLSQHAQWFLRAWNSNRFDTIRLPELDQTVATQIARAVARIYEVAYGRYPENLPERCVREWSANPARNPRRLVRLLIHRLDIARTVPQSA
jgi:hypothetical protein